MWLLGQCLHAIFITFAWNLPNGIPCKLKIEYVLTWVYTNPSFRLSFQDFNAVKWMNLLLLNCNDRKQNTLKVKWPFTFISGIGNIPLLLMGKWVYYFKIKPHDTRRALSKSLIKLHQLPLKSPISYYSIDQMTRSPDQTGVMLGLYGGDRKSTILSC